jgi:hypothetical protein
MTLATAKATGGGSAGSVWPYLAGLLKLALPLAIVSSPVVAVSWFGARRLLRAARDDRERRQLRWFWVTQSLVFVAAIKGFHQARVHFHHWEDFRVLAVFTVVLLALNFLWLPRIWRRRHEAEMREDPAKATAKRRREKLARTIAWGLGLGGPWVGMVIKHVYFLP